MRLAEGQSAEGKPYPPEAAVRMRRIGRRAVIAGEHTIDPHETTGPQDTNTICGPRESPNRLWAERPKGKENASAALAPEQPLLDC